jgi:uncharacterized protein (TIGR03083 family)
VTQVKQFYDASGVPITVPTRAHDVIAAWRSHRRRLRGWFAALPRDRWSDPTRCSEWSVTDMAQHLISGAQFLGFTLHQAGKGEATRLLEGFDAQETPAMTTALWGGRSPDDLLAELEGMDARVDHEIAALADQGWSAWAEAPPGRVPAYVAINHFLFDSWVHERDVMLPANEKPVVVANEAAAVASYVLALAGVAGAADEGPPACMTLAVELTDLDRHLAVAVEPAGTRVGFTPGDGQPDVSAPAGTLVDVATGRSAVADIGAGGAAAGYLTHLAKVMA